MPNIPIQFQGDNKTLKDNNQLLTAIADALGVGVGAIVMPPIMTSGNAEAKEVLPEVDFANEKFFNRSIQNVGNTDIYVRVGDVASNVVYHRILYSGQEFIATRFEDSVSVYGAGAWTVATFIEKIIV